MSSMWNQPVGGYGNSYASRGAVEGGATQPMEAQPMGAYNDACAVEGVGTRALGGGAVEDFTATGINRLEDTDLFQRALNISEPQECAEPGTRNLPPPGFRKKVVRRVEVPYTRKVKVPTTTQKIVPGTTTQRVATKKLIQVPSFKVVDEEYTEFEEREATRDKEIWVKQIVQEKYITKVPIKKVRQVEKPTTEVREVEEWVDIQVPTNRVVDVPGFRVDEVEDTKIVEVEEYQNYEYRPQPAGELELARTREVGRIPGQHVSRSIGSEVYHTGHPDVQQLDIDSNPGGDGGGYGTRSLGGVGTRSLGSARGSARGAALPPANVRAQPGQSFYRGLPNQQYGDRSASNAFRTDTYTDPNFVRPAGEFLKKPQGGGAGSSDNPSMFSDRKSIGITLKNTHTRHTDGTGVLVTKVERGGPAARAGLRQNDIITSANNVDTKTVQEFRGLVSSLQGPLPITVNRDGRRNINITLYR